ncbi:hypothetical protein Peur_045587 [Populus x canadensis]
MWDLLSPHHPEVWRPHCQSLMALLRLLLKAGYVTNTVVLKVANLVINAILRMVSGNLAGLLLHPTTIHVLLEVFQDIWVVVWSNLLLALLPALVSLPPLQESVSMPPLLDSLLVRLVCIPYRYATKQESSCLLRSMKQIQISRTSNLRGHLNRLPKLARW